MSQRPKGNGSGFIARLVFLQLEGAEDFSQSGSRKILLLLELIFF